MSADGAAWGVFPVGDVAGIARRAWNWAETTVKRLSLPNGMTSGPIIPVGYNFREHSKTWQGLQMASCTYLMASSFQWHRPQYGTAGLMAAQAGLHVWPGGYLLWQVGLNPRHLLHRREWHRLVSGLLLHTDLPQLLSSCTTLAVEGLPLERRLGTPRFLALVGSMALTSQALYVLCTRLAASWFPESSLADAYFQSYIVGFSGVALAVNVVAGYMREADYAAARVEPTDDYVFTGGRLGVWSTLFFSNCLLAPSISLPSQLCGLAAGLMHVYGARFLGWLYRRLRLQQRRRLQAGRLVATTPALLNLGGAASHPAMGWWDLGSHLVLGAGTCLMLHLASRYASSTRNA